MDINGTCLLETAHLNSKPNHLREKRDVKKKLSDCGQNPCSSCSRRFSNRRTFVPIRTQATCKPSMWFRDCWTQLTLTCENNMKTTVLLAFNTGPTSGNSATKLPNNFPSSIDDCAKDKTSPANRKSMQCVIPFDESKLSHRLSILISAWQIVTRRRRARAQNTFCRTPPVMLNFVSWRSNDLSKWPVVQFRNHPNHICFEKSYSSKLFRCVAMDTIKCLWQI